MTPNYVRFLSLCHAFDSADIVVCGLDETAKHLLNVIFVHHAQGKPLTVSEAMALGAIASPATIHRKLDALREIGMVEQTFEGTNRRTKFLSPTAAANAYFAHIGEMMKQSLQAA